MADDVAAALEREFYAWRTSMAPERDAKRFLDRIKALVAQALAERTTVLWPGEIGTVDPHPGSRLVQEIDDLNRVVSDLRAQLADVPRLVADAVLADRQRAIPADVAAALRVLEVAAESPPGGMTMWDVVLPRRCGQIGGHV